MVNDRSTGSWSKVAGQSGIYQRIVGAKLQPQDKTKSDAATHAVEAMKTRLDMLIGQTQNRSRSER